MYICIYVYNVIIYIYRQLYRGMSGNRCGSCRWTSLPLLRPADGCGCYNRCWEAAATDEADAILHLLELSCEQLKAAWAMMLWG